MIDPRAARLWSHRGLFLGLCALVLFYCMLPLGAAPAEWPLPAALVNLLPDGLSPHEWPGPDYLLCLTLVWVFRRPEFIPAPMIVLVFFAADLLSMRPPGLWTAIVLAGTEFVRRRENATRDLPFLGEWLMAASVLAAMVLAERFALAVFMVPRVDLGPVLIRLVATILIYPFMALLMHYAFGLRRAATGEVDAFGKKL